MEARPLEVAAVPSLITGGTGFLGSYLAKILMAHHERPVLFDVAPVGKTLQGDAERYDYVRGSLSNLSLLVNALRNYRIERIFHLGGMLSVPSEHDPWSAFEVNVAGTFKVLEAARLENVRQVIYSSTIAVYSKDIPTDIITDVTLQRPTTMYGGTKVFGELMGRFYARKFGLDFRAVRLPSVVGPGAKTAHMSIYNAWAIEEPLKGNPYELRVMPETRCPTIYFKDSARAIWLLSEAEASKVPTAVYNIAGITPPYSAQELVGLVRDRIPGACLTFNPDPDIMELLQELGRLKIDDSNAVKEWNWHLAYDLPAMVDDFIEEFNQNRSFYL
jgi:nucleoside-diphosphate-sugar epimerase